MDDSFFKEFGNVEQRSLPMPGAAPNPPKSMAVDQPAPAAPLPPQSAPLSPDAAAQAAAPQQAAPQAPAPQAPARPMDSFLSEFGNSKASASAASNDSDGGMAELAIPESPLSIFERAHLGWIKKPEDQERFLRSNFDDVNVRHNGDSVSFLVKKEGKWFEADPAFAWHMNKAAAITGAVAGGAAAGLPGAAIVGGVAGTVIPSLLDKKNYRDLPGDIAQFLGEYGMRTVGASVGAAAGLAGGTAVGGPLLGAAGFVAGGAAGAAGIDVADNVARMAQGSSAPGMRPYTQPGDVKEQMIASAIMGVQQELGGALGKWGASKAITNFASTMEKYANGDLSKAAGRKLLGAMGADDRLALARLEDTKQTMKYDLLKDADLKSSNLTKEPLLDKERFKVTYNVSDMVDGALREQGKSFDALVKDPRIAKAKFNFVESKDPEALAPAAQAMSEMQKAQIITPSGALNPNRQLGAGDANAIKFIQALQKRAKDVPYSEARALVGDANTILNDGVANSNLFRIVTQLKNDMHVSIAGQLHDIDPVAGKAYTDTLNKYATVKQLSDIFEDKTNTDTKAARLIKQLMSPTSNGSKGMLEGLVNAGIDRKELLKIYQIEAAEQSSGWFTNKKILGKYVPVPGGRASRIVGAGVDAAKQLDEGTLGRLPYMDKALSVMKKTNPEQLKQLLLHPQGIDMIVNGVSKGAEGEKSMTQQLLESAGVMAPKGPAGQPPEGQGQ